MKFIRTKWRGEVYEPKSIHALKGLEADIVIVSDLVSNELGFPSLKEDDPILEIVLSNKENFPHAEERRLLYVAMTRAKNKCYLISDPNIPSEFSLELKENKYNVEEIDNDDDPNKKCPKCNEGQIYLKSYKNSNGEKAEFYSCNNYVYLK